MVQGTEPAGNVGLVHPVAVGIVLNTGPMITIYFYSVSRCDRIALV